MNNAFQSEGNSFTSYYLIDNNVHDHRLNTNILIDARFERNFEQLITERGDETNFENNGNNVIMFSEIFDKIKEKLFILNECDFELSETDKQKYNLKYNTFDINTIINNFKKSMVLVHTKKLALEIEIENKTKMYTDFCIHITELLKINLNENDNETDIQLKELKELLSSRIDLYYDSLNLDNLIKEKFDIVGEYSFLKSTITNLSSIAPSTTCSICFENQVMWYMDPCGHTVCNECKSKTEQSKSCHFCRYKRTKYMRLYI